MMTMHLPELLSYPFNTAAGIDVSSAYQQIREGPRLVRVSLPFGEPAWLVTCYEDVRFVLGDRRFSRAASQGRDIPRQSESVNSAGILAMDPPDQTRLRGLLAKAFTMRRVEALRPGVRNAAKTLIDQLVAAGPPADIIENFAVPFSIEVICELLGVPADDRAKFRKWSDARLSTNTLSEAELKTCDQELAAYMTNLVSLRRERPADDLMSALIEARDKDDRLSEQELIGLCNTLLLAGHEATSNQIPNFLYYILDHPGVHETLRGKPRLIPGAVEELLRFIPLMAGAGTMPRYALEDVRIGGTVIGEGEAVIASLGSANRDESVFNSPAEFDMHRQGNKHLAFGHGAHHCVGAALARVELQESLGIMVRTFPQLHLAKPVQWKTQLVMRGPMTMFVGW